MKDNLNDERMKNTAGKLFRASEFSNILCLLFMPTTSFRIVISFLIRRDGGDEEDGENNQNGCTSKLIKRPFIIHLG